tara:strand:- start:3679 stop:3831 length:153 start_codon:yes stop_codon:yes gene_type:complete
MPKSNLPPKLEEPSEKPRKPSKPPKEKTKDLTLSPGQTWVNAYRYGLWDI